jgi:hypothetical protein
MRLGHHYQIVFLSWKTPHSTNKDVIKNIYANWVITGAHCVLKLVISETNLQKNNQSVRRELRVKWGLSVFLPKAKKTGTQQSFEYKTSEF